jgi:hypothetical protein
VCFELLQEDGHKCTRAATEPQAAGANVEGYRQFCRVGVIVFTDQQGRNLRLGMYEAHSRVAQIKFLFMG